MKRRFTIAAIAASIVSLAMMSSGISAESAHEGDTEKAGETVAETEADTAEFDAVAFLEAIKGTYEPLFPIITDPQNGDQLFSHEYRFVDGLSLAGLMEGSLYETEDEDAGEFKYFYMMPDTPDTTYHLEFRYGSDIDALSQYNEGPYAYWLAAGFPVDADEEMIENVITLFCEENLAEMQ